ncbi:MAG: cytochrome b/b6 domain-containing protein [Methanocellales archaeon]|nr:cytochrome b/b6 domain-containing protein [Methanocellales archaeon]
MAEQVVERWNKPMMAMHWIHMVTCLILIITGFRIYLGWGLPSAYSQARALHMVAVVGFLIANLILLPYGMVLEALEGIKHYGIKQGIKHFMKANLFGMEDARRLKAILLNFFGKQKGYPALTIYDEKAGLYANRSHPVTKILIPLEGIFILLITLSGIVLYNINWTIVGLNIGAFLRSIATVTFWRTLHLGSMYYFILDLFIHVGILQADTKLKHAWKAMFLTGKEDIKTSGYAKIVKK